MERQNVNNNIYGKYAGNDDDNDDTGGYDNNDKENNW